MCSNSVDIVRYLEDTFVSDMSKFSFDTHYKIYRSLRKPNVFDYICYASNQQCAQEALENWVSICVEKLPYIKDYIKVSVAPHGFNISLNRKLCFSNGLEAANKLGKSFGSNTLFINKIFDLSVVDLNSSDSLSSLRLNAACEVLMAIIKACGGSFSLGENSSNEFNRIHITMKNICCGECTILLVGPVNSNLTPTDSDEYKRSRMGDICSMCEHKSEINNDINKQKLLKAIIYFDLLQSTLWRSVTLNLSTEDISKISSCKGSMFVLYNYARLHSLCQQFDEKVNQKIYPPLPALVDTDFSLLNNEEEWKIMLDCVLCWPSVVQKSIIDLKCSRPKIHLIFEFLKTLSTNFSQYYRRIRIFTEPRSHLFPVLFARMHLLKSLLIVFENALDLVCISPLKKM